MVNIAFVFGQNASKIGFRIFAILLILFTFGLGFWQVQRMGEKEHLIAQIATSTNKFSTLETMNLTHVEANNFSSITAKGQYRPTLGYILMGQLRNGIDGIALIVPFVLEDGQWVMVHRGWRPRLMDGAQTFTNDDVVRTVQMVLPESIAPHSAAFEYGELRGRIRMFPRKRWFMPDDKPSQRMLYNVLHEKLQQFWAHNLMPFYIEEDAGTVPPGFTSVSTDTPHLHNNHLIYAITWFTLAFALLVAWIVRERQVQN